MASPMCQMIGTWEEITHCVRNFAGQQLRVEVYSVEAETEAVKEDANAAVLREIAGRAAQINPKPEMRDWLREGRAGGMFGYEPTE